MRVKIQREISHVIHEWLVWKSPRRSSNRNEQLIFSSPYRDKETTTMHSPLGKGRHRSLHSPPHVKFTTPKVKTKASIVVVKVSTLWVELRICLQKHHALLCCSHDRSNNRGTVVLNVALTSNHSEAGRTWLPAQLSPLASLIQQTWSAVVLTGPSGKTVNFTSISRPLKKYT